MAARSLTGSTYSRCCTTTNRPSCSNKKGAARKLRFLFSLRCYLLLLQESFDGSTLETTNVLSPWSIFMPELLPLLEPLLELPLALWSEAGMFPVEAVVLPVPLAPEAVVSADGVPELLPVLLAPVLLLPPMLPLPVLAFPLAPGVLSLIAPPLEDPDPLPLGVVE